MYNETRNFKKLKVCRPVYNIVALISSFSTFRKYTTRRTTSNQLYRILASWASSKSVAERCGWENVCKSFQSTDSTLDGREGQWNRASEDFFESFRNYDEAGSPQRIQVLKYLVLANMLTGSEVNPFDSQETKPSVDPT